MHEIHAHITHYANEKCRKGNTYYMQNYGGVFLFHTNLKKLYTSTHDGDKPLSNRSIY